MKDSSGWQYARAYNDAMREAVGGSIVAARLCPFCLHKISLLCVGVYGPEVVRCHQCGEIVAFPPVEIGRDGSGLRSLVVPEPRSDR